MQDGAMKVHLSRKAGLRCYRNCVDSPGNPYKFNVVLACKRSGNTTFKTALVCPNVSATILIITCLFLLTELFIVDSQQIPQCRYPRIKGDWAEPL